MAVKLIKSWQSVSLTRDAMKELSLLEQITQGIGESTSGEIFHWRLDLVTNTLDDIWNPPHPDSVSRCRAAERGDEGLNIEEAPANYASAPRKALGSYERRMFPPTPAPKRPPPWYIGMSSAFSKDITKIDRKLQGRILEALREITEDPVSPKGDTKKPLTGELQGCWRYRLGDYRLIYSPDKSTGDITLLAFASRGSAYDS